MYRYSTLQHGHKMEHEYFNCSVYYFSLIWYIYIKYQRKTTKKKYYHHWIFTNIQAPFIIAKYNVGCCTVQVWINTYMKVEYIFQQLCEFRTYTAGVYDFCLIWYIYIKYQRKKTKKKCCLNCLHADRWHAINEKMFLYK